MCRLACFIGVPIQLADIVTRPKRSILTQSYDSKERQPHFVEHLSNASINGDGFGVGWYSVEEKGDNVPCVFTSVLPAWNNCNLHRIAQKVVSPLIFAHVRAAYPGMPVSEQNCHPFTCGKYMWMHNGCVGDFFKVRRALLASLRDDVYNCCPSFDSDSAVCFAVFLNQLADLETEHSPLELSQKMQMTLRLICDTCEQEGAREHSLLNFVLSDGKTVIATRFASDDDKQCASLYIASGTDFTSRPIAPSGCEGSFEGSQSVVRGDVSQESEEDACCSRDGKTVENNEGDFHILRCNRRTKLAVVASEPITGGDAEWTKVPKNTMVVLSREKGRDVNVCYMPALLRATEATQASGAQSQLGIRRKQRDSSDSLSLLLKKMALSEDVLDSVVSGNMLTARKYVIGDRKGLPRGAAIKNMPDDTLTGHKSSILSILMDGKVMYTGGSDTRIGVWNMSTLSEKRERFLKQEYPVMALATCDQHLFSAGGNKILCWSKHTYESLPHKSVIIPGCGPILSMCKAGSLLYFSGQDGLLMTVNTSKFDEVDVMHDSESLGTLQICFSHNSFILAMMACRGFLCTGSADTMVKVWDQATLQERAVFKGHKGPVLCLTYSTNDGLLFSGARDNTIRVWDMEMLCCRRTLSGHTDDVIGLACFDASSNSGRMSDQLLSQTMLCSLSADSSCRVWSTRSWQCLQCAFLNKVPSSLAIVGECIFVGDSKGLVTEWMAEGLDSLSGDLAHMNPQDGVISPRYSFDGVSSGNSPFSTYFNTNSEASKYGDSSSGGVNSARDAIKAASPAKAGQSTAHQTNRALTEALNSFIAIRTISGNPDHREDCFEGAKFITRLLDRSGAVTKIVTPEEGRNPIVLGKFESDKNKPTVTFYGHYDVQPALEPDWKYDPFEMQCVDGFFCGRGTTDNKGPILAFLFAVKELIREVGGISQLPVNVAMIVEGEEENGSSGFAQTIESNKHWFQNTELIVISNTLWLGKDKPCITCGMRGMIVMSVNVDGPKKDLHSGNEGGIFNEPMTDLVKVLSTLLDNSNRVLVDGFYEGVENLELGKLIPDMDSLDQDFSLGCYASSIGVPKLTASSKEELFSRRWLLPTLSVVDVRTSSPSDKKNAHYCFGPTRFSVIPHRAVGQVSIRFVASQDPRLLTRAVEMHVRKAFAALDSANRISVQVHNTGEAWEGNRTHQMFTACKHAIKESWDEDPLHSFEGGTMPVTSTLERVLEAPAVLIPLGQSTDNPHLANERIRSTNLFAGKDVMKNIIVEVAKTLKEGQ